MKKAHIIGICGIGMSATALLLKDLGYEISGSDDECFEPVKGLLQRNDVSINPTYSSGNIPSNVDLIVVGRSARLDPQTNEEVREAISRGVPVKSFPEIIADAVSHKRVVGIAGSYGKSTTTAALTWLLESAGQDPGYFIGALATDFPRPARLGKGCTFVVEADEYPTSHTDSRAKFMSYHIDDLILTSVVHDHFNVYPTVQSYQKPFVDLAASLPSSAIVIACADEPNAVRVASSSSAKLITYSNGSHPDAIWSAGSIIYGEQTTFVLNHRGKALVDIRTSQLGLHNIQNIVGAAAFVIERGLATAQQIREAVAEFRGVKRRLDMVTPRSTVRVYEGFGSSKEKARAAIDAVITHFPHCSVKVLFEPHTFSWRNRSALPWYDDVFRGVGAVFVYSPAKQGAGTHSQLTHDEIVARIKASGIKTMRIEDGEVHSVVQELEPSDVVLILTSGNLHGTLPTLIEEIEGTFPSAA